MRPAVLGWGPVCGGDPVCRKLGWLGAGHPVSGPRASGGMADALSSGGSVLTGVGVQVPPCAPPFYARNRRCRDLASPLCHLGFRIVPLFGNGECPETAFWQAPSAVSGRSVGGTNRAGERRAARTPGAGRTPSPRSTPSGGRPRRLRGPGGLAGPAGVSRSGHRQSWRSTARAARCRGRLSPRSASGR